MTRAAIARIQHSTSSGPVIASTRRAARKRSAIARRDARPARRGAGADQGQYRTAGPRRPRGSLALANNVTNRDEPLVARLRAAGAVYHWQGHLSEWANIRSSTRSPAGARSAARPATLLRSTATRAARQRSGAAVAAGLVRMAIGHRDRRLGHLPRAINGIVGFSDRVACQPDFVIQQP